MLNAKKIAQTSNNGSIRASDTEVTTLWQSDGEFEFEKRTNGKLDQEIRFRNVADRNHRSALQFSITDYTGGRKKYISFSLPDGMIEPFIEALKTPM